jgi:hypothetical protein
MKGRPVIGPRRLSFLPLHFPLPLQLPLPLPLPLHLVNLVLRLSSVLPLALHLPLLIFPLFQCVLSLWFLLPLCNLVALKAVFLPFLRLISIYHPFLDLTPFLISHLP